MIISPIIFRINKILLSMISAFIYCHENEIIRYQLLQIIIGAGFRMTIKQRFYRLDNDQPNPHQKYLDNLVNIWTDNFIKHNNQSTIIHNLSVFFEKALINQYTWLGYNICKGYYGVDVIKPNIFDSLDAIYDSYFDYINGNLLLSGSDIAKLCVYSYAIEYLYATSNIDILLYYHITPDNTTTNDLVTKYDTELIKSFAKKFTLSKFKYVIDKVTTSFNTWPENNQTIITINKRSCTPIVNTKLLSTLIKNYYLKHGIPVDICLRKGKILIRLKNRISI